MQGDDQKIHFLLVLVDELASKNDQELVIWFNNIKSNLQKAVPNSSRNRPWNMATGIDLTMGSFVVYPTNDGQEFSVFVMCGFDSYASTGSLLCRENDKKGGKPTYSVYSDEKGQEIQVGCS